MILQPFPSSIVVERGKPRGKQLQDITEGHWPLIEAIVGALNGIEEVIFQFQSPDPTKTMDQFFLQIFDTSVTKFIGNVSLTPFEEKNLANTNTSTDSTNINNPTTNFISSQLPSDVAPVYYSNSTDLNSILTFRLRVPPLRLGMIAVINERLCVPQYRLVSSTTLMPPALWIQRLSMAQFFDLLPSLLPSNENQSICMEEEQLLIGEEDVGTKYNRKETAGEIFIESKNDELKQPVSCILTIEELIPKLTRYLTCGLLNSDRPKLSVGVDDSGICIGFSIDDLNRYPTGTIHAEFQKSLLSIFPALPAHSVRLKLNQLKGTIPSDWNETLNIAVITIKTSETMNATIQALLCSLHGLAYVEFEWDDSGKHVTGASIYTPTDSTDLTSLLKLQPVVTTPSSLWSLITEEEKEDLRQRSSEYYRYVLHIHVRTDDEAKGGLSSTFPRVCARYRTKFYVSSKEKENDLHSVFVPVLAEPTSSVKTTMTTTTTATTPTTTTATATTSSTNDKIAAVAIAAKIKTTPNSNRNANSNYHYTVPMCPLAMWLRARSNTSYSVKVRSHLHSNHSRCILVGHYPNEVTEQLVKANLQAKYSVNVDIFASYPITPNDLAATASASAIAPVSASSVSHRCPPALCRSTIRMWVVVYSPEAIAIVKNLIRMDRYYDESIHRLVLLIHPRWLREKHLLEEMRKFVSEIKAVVTQWFEILDLILIDPSLKTDLPLSLPSSSSSSTSTFTSSSASSIASSSSSNLSSSASVLSDSVHPVILLHGSISDDELRFQFSEYVHRSAGYPLPCWDFISNGFIARTSVAISISTGILETLTVPSRCELFTIFKTSPASGISCTLRVAAFICHEHNALVLWLNKLTATNNLFELIRNEWMRIQQCSTSTQIDPKRVVIVADDHITQSNSPGSMRSVLQNLAQQFKLSICLVVVVRIPLQPSVIAQHIEAAGRFSCAINPFLINDDIPLICRALQVGLKSSDEFKDQQMKIALDCATENAIKIHSTSQKYDKHIFIFCLAALNGKYEPAEDMIKRIYTAMQSKASVSTSRIIEVAHVLAFVGSFSYFPASRWLEPKLGNSTQKQLESTPEFNELFEDDPRLSQGQSPSYRCVHPFLARLYLAHTTQLQWTSQRAEASTIILNAWKYLISSMTGMFSPEQRLSFVRELLTDRARYCSSVSHLQLGQN